MAESPANCMDKDCNIKLVWYRNQTRRCLLALFTAFASFMLLSCSSKYDFDFDNSDDAIECYQKFCDGIKSKDKMTSTEAVEVMNEWQEVRDTVLAFIQDDSAYYAHSWLPSHYNAIEDSVKQHLLNVMLEQDYSLKDIAIIRHGTSIYAKDEDVTKSAAEIMPFFSRLDSIHIYNTNKESILSMYRDFLSITRKNGIKNIKELQSFISMEDRIFRTFLHHLSEMNGENMSDITEQTELICNDVFRSAGQGKLDSKEVLLYMAIRTNRRILLNAETCITGLETIRKMPEAQQNAYYWMAIQPFVSIDPFGMAVLSHDQFERICKVADDLQRLDRSGKTGADKGKLPQMVNLILKMYITTM